MRGEDHDSRLLSGIFGNDVPNWERSDRRLLSKGVVLNLIALEMRMDKIFGLLVSDAAERTRTDGDKLFEQRPAALGIDLERAAHCGINLLLREADFRV